MCINELIERLDKYDMLYAWNLYCESIGDTENEIRYTDALPDNMFPVGCPVMIMVKPFDGMLGVVTAIEEDGTLNISTGTNDNIMINPKGVELPDILDESKDYTYHLNGTWHCGSLEEALDNKVIESKIADYLYKNTALKEELESKHWCI